MKHTADEDVFHPARSGSVPGMGANTLEPPLPPQLAKAADELPEGDGWSFEPKLDGFRVIVFVDGDESTCSHGTASRSTATSRR